MTANLQHSSPDGSGFSAGAAQVDITPKGSVGMTGYMLREGPSNGVLDPLFARALYLEQGKNQSLLISCDLLGLSRENVSQARLKIQAATGIPSQGILLSCTHTHSGPATMQLLECAAVENDYLSWLLDHLVQLSRSAKAGAAPAQARTGREKLASLQENRRKPDGPIDTDLSVMALENLDGSPIAVLVNFACHPTCLQASNRSISGDYPGYAMGLLQDATGAVSLFFNGAAGNIRPALRGSIEAMQTTGGILAGRVLEMLPQLVLLETPALSVAQLEIQAPLKSFPSADEIVNFRFDPFRPVFYASQRTSQLEAALERLLAAWRASTLADLRAGRLVDSIPVEVQVIRCGPVIWVGFPGELFVELGLEIKRRLEGDQVFLCGYSNGAIGYVPTRQAYKEGGYEVDEAFILHNYPAAIAPETGEKITETAVYLAQALSE
jgi:hypothetical protein